MTGVQTCALPICIFDVTVKPINQGASDYYNPQTKELCLLAPNYNSNSIASIGIAAHECGHAIQDATEYAPLALQRYLAPVCARSSQIGIYIAILGLMFGWVHLQNVGIILFSLGVFFTLLLLPIEFDASNRALRILEDNRILVGEELVGARKVLRAAGMTYVAAAASSAFPSFGFSFSHADGDAEITDIFPGFTGTLP